MEHRILVWDQEKINDDNLKPENNFVIKDIHNPLF